MITPIRSLRFLALPLALWAAVPAHASPLDAWQQVATACTPSTKQALQNATFNTTFGTIKPNSPPTGVNPLSYTCNVLDGDPNSPTPTWTKLILQHNDQTGGLVKATLYRKPKLPGGPTVVAAVVSNASGGFITNDTVGLGGGLNFAAFAYYIVIELTAVASTGTPPVVHMVQLE